jgi:hypothetical protein
VTVAEVYNACQRSPDLKRLWHGVSVAANALVQEGLKGKDAQMIASKVDEYNDALALLSLNLKTLLSFDEWDVLKFEEHA